MWRFVTIVLFVVGCASAREPLAGEGGNVDAPLDVVMVDGCAPATETCNELDDDCDLSIDEDFTMKGTACSEGAGACAASGTWVCAANELACDAMPGAPQSEVCDAIDNDCDAQIDEDHLVGTACDGPDADTCEDGMIVCDGPSATMCTDQPGSSAEVCDAIDNDCDMQLDEGFGLGVACDGADTDACLEGSVVCNGGGGTMCSDTSGDNTELCNGLDDDCRNGTDDLWPVGQACTVGLGACARSGQLICDGAQTGVQCSATPGAPVAELCGNGSDEDCNGSDAGCPPNDGPAGAIDISNGGQFTVDLSAARDDNWATLTGQDCGMQGGRDVFYELTLPAAEVVYFDTFGSNYDTMIRVFTGSCTALGAVQRCEDDACGQQRSLGAMQLAAGTHCVVIDQYSSSATAGATVLNVRRGGRSGIELATASGSVSGTTTGKANLSIAGCEANTSQPDVGYFFASCPGTTTINANTCTGTSWDTVIYVRTGSATTGDVACDDDTPGCGPSYQSRITGAAVTGPNLQWIIIDGFGMTGNGAYTLSYSLQ